MGVLPVQVKRAEVTFVNTRLPLPGLFEPANLSILSSVHVAIPPGDPMIEGDVDRLNITFDSRGIPQIQNLSTIAMGVKNFDMPPVKEVSGKFAIGGFDKGLNGLWFAGRLGGDLDGYKVIMTTAFASPRSRA